MRLAAKATDSVITDDNGSRTRLNAMLRMIVLRVVTALMALITVDMRSWNGTTAHATLKPGATPWTIEHDRVEQQVHADERERVEQPLQYAPRAAAISESHVCDGQRDENVTHPGLLSGGDDTKRRAARRAHVGGIYVHAHFR